MADIAAVAIQLVKWAQPDQLALVERIFTSLGETDMAKEELTIFVRLGWYPIAAVMYAAGISALSAGRYDALHRCLFAPVKSAQSTTDKSEPLLDHVVTAMTDLFNNFRGLPGAERQSAPRSEHMLLALQPIVEDQLYLGRRYEDFYDRFEIMMALSFGNAHTGLTSPYWGPPGRFAWKERSPFSSQKPFSLFVTEAKSQGDSWPALRAGFFNGSAVRFAEVADGYAQLIQRIREF